MHGMCLLQRVGAMGCAYYRGWESMGCAYYRGWGSMGGAELQRVGVLAWNVLTTEGGGHGMCLLQRVVAMGGAELQRVVVHGRC